MRVWRVLLSYLGAVCKVKHADDHKAEYPLAAEVVNRNRTAQNSCYMDDLIPSADTFEARRDERAAKRL